MNEAVTNWPLGVETDVFHQHLAGALRDAAVDLAVQQHRIEHGADVVDDAVAHDLDFAGFLVDFDFADVAAVGKVLRPALCRRRWRQARAPSAAGTWPDWRRRGDLLDGHGAVGLRRREHAVGEFTSADRP